MQKFLSAPSIVLLSLSSLSLIGLEIKLVGWLLLSIGIACTFLSKDREFKKHILLIYLALILIGITAISTSIAPSNVVSMSVTLLSALFLPYLISKYIYKDNVISFSLRHEKKWTGKQVLYLCFNILIIYALLHLALRVSNSYLNWTVEPTLPYLFSFFIGINTFGIYDELFFRGTVQKILMRYISFPFANLTQSIIFTSFLYQLGFQGWAALGIFVFSLSQGYVLQKTNSFLYLIVIHVIVDLMLFLALINLHYPELLPIFLIK